MRRGDPAKPDRLSICALPQRRALTRFLWTPPPTHGTVSECTASLQKAGNTPGRPLADGNGRSGRLWQSLILAHWNPLFAGIAVECMIFQHQTAYHHALRERTRHADLAPFISFMLGIILDPLKLTVSPNAPSLSPASPPSRRVDSGNGR